MNLSQFISSLPTGEQQALQERLDLLSQHGMGRQFVLNLNAEVRFIPAIWQMLHQALITASPDVADLYRAFVGVFQSYILSGGAIQSPWPTRYGRATTESNFYALLVKHGLATSPTGAKRFVTNLMKKPLSLTQTRLAHKPLGQYLIWATFDETNPSGDPFHKLLKDAEGIRACLGLDPNHTGDMLLLTYALPASVEPLYPTVADAYAGGWNWYYRPSLLHERYGLTLCWRERTDAFPCPEVVHTPVNGDCLMAPIAKVKEI